MENGQAKHLATLLQAIEDLQIEKIEYQAEFKKRMEKLKSEANGLKWEILSGQSNLLDPAEKEETEVSQ